MNKDNVDNNDTNIDNKDESTNDSLEAKDYLGALFTQKVNEIDEDRLIYYEIENIYKDEEKRLYRNKIELKKNPPVLVMRDNQGNEANFMLTENLTKELKDTLNEIQRAYYGFSGPVDMDVPDKLMDKLFYYLKKNPIKVLIPILLMILSVLLF